MHVNLTQLQQLGRQWKSTVMEHLATQLMHNGTTANAGNLVGNRMFWKNDYMVSSDSTQELYCQARRC